MIGSLLHDWITLALLLIFCVFNSMYHDAIAEALTIVTQKLADCNRQHDGLPPEPPMLWVLRLLLP